MNQEKRTEIPGAALGLLGWAGIITLLWFSRYHFGPGQWWEGFRKFFLGREFYLATFLGNWAVFLPAIAALPGLLALFRTAGERSLPLLRFRERKDGMLDSLLAGFGVVAMAVLGAGLCGLLMPVPYRSATVLLIVAGIADYMRRADAVSWWMGAGGLREAWRGSSTLARPFLALAGAITATHVLGMETGWDAMTYHLRIPMFFQLRHRVFDAWHFPAGTFPMTGEMLFTLAKILEGDTLVRLMVAAWGVMVLAAARRLSAEVAGKPDSRLTAVLVASPFFLLLVTRAYTDLPVMLFGTAAWYAWFGWRRTGAPKLAAFSGAMVGCAMGCKYTAFLLLPAFAVAWWLAPDTPRRKRAAITWIAAAAFFVVPWLARNYLIRGNPLHPFFSAWVGMPTERVPDIALPFEGTGNEGKVLASTVGGKVDSLLLGDGRFTGPIAPVFAAFLPLLLLFGPRADSAREGARYATLAFMAMWFMLCPDLRFLAPVLPLALCLIFTSLDEETRLPALRRGAHWILQAGLVAGALFGSGYQWTTFAPFAMPLGLESRRDKLELGLRPAPFLAYAVRAAEERVPRAERILAVCAIHSYYLERETLTDVHYGRAHVTAVVRAGRDEAGIAKRLRQLGVRWILAAEDLAGTFLPVHGFYDAPKEQWDAWVRFLARRTEVAWQTDGFVLYRVGVPHAPRPLPSAPPVDAIALEDTTLTMRDGKPTLTLRVLDMVSPGLAGIATPRLVRARAYSALRDFQRALASYDAAVKGGLDTPETDLGRARALYALGRPAEAVKAAMRALERNPRSAYANGLLAIMLAERGAMAQARELARRAAFLDPDEPQYRKMLAEMSGPKTATKP